MPTYEYSCARCGKEEDFSMSVSEYNNFIAVCGNCGSMNLQRKWTGIASHVEHAD